MSLKWRNAGMSLIQQLRAGAGEMASEALRGIGSLARGLASPVERKVTADEWWRGPGIGIQFQVEHRPGWNWNRDFDEFNASMMDENGRLTFNGPFCRTDEWVGLSRDVGVDYHMMEIKWHDGICYFDTRLTDWKTRADYAGSFAELSRSAGIPFMYYYSAVFDHNPQFDPIQPSPMTLSFIGMPGNPVYEEYIRGQYREIMEQYRPDGMWIDWFWPDKSTKVTIDFFGVNYPDVVLAFNASNLVPGAREKLHYTSGEAHELDGPYLRVTREEGGFITVFSSAWKWSALNRRTLANPWELITPAGRWWQDPTLRDDPHDLVRMAAVVMASGGKLCVGVSSQLDGGIYPDQVRQMRILGDWYGPRRALFAKSVPLAYRRREPPGVKVSPGSVKAIACRRGGDVMLHLVNMDGATRPIRLELRGDPWERTARAYLEPAGGELEMTRSPSGLSLLVGTEQVDRVDTIVRLASRNNGDRIHSVPIIY